MPPTNGCWPTCSALLNRHAEEGRWLKRLRLDAYGHWRQHTEQILAWREEKGILGEALG